jgi:antitoxin HicB
MMHMYKIPLVLTHQPEGGYTVTSPLLPELVTEGDPIDEALLHVHDAVQAVVALYEGLGKLLPATLRPSPEADAIQFEFFWDVPCSPVRSPGNCGAWATKHSYVGGRVTPAVVQSGHKDRKVGTLHAAVGQLGLTWQDFEEA